MISSWQTTFSKSITKMKRSGRRIPRSIFSPAAAVYYFQTINGSPTDYLIQMLVLANKMVNVQFSSRFRLGPACVRAPPTGQGGNFFSTVCVLSV